MSYYTSCPHYNHKTIINTCMHIVWLWYYASVVHNVPGIRMSRDRTKSVRGAVYYSSSRTNRCSYQLGRKLTSSLGQDLLFMIFFFQREGSLSAVPGGSRVVCDLQFTIRFWCEFNVLIKLFKLKKKTLF